MLTVTLSSVEQKFPLPTNFIRTVLPDSILASALQDPTCTTLHLTNPAVTPEVMTLLVELSQGKEPTKHCPGILDVHRYLNIPQVCGYADPLYDALVSGDVYIRQTIYQQALREDRHDLFIYLVRWGTSPMGHDFVTAAKTGALKNLQYMVTILLLSMDRFNDQPVATTEAKTINEEEYSELKDLTREQIEHLSIAALENAINQNKLEVVRLVLAKLPIQTISYHMLEAAIDERNAEIFRLLFQDPRIKVKAKDWDYMLDEAIDEVDPVWDCIALVVTRPEVTMRKLYIKVLPEAVEKGRIDIVQLILANQRFDPTQPIWCRGDSDKGIIWGALRYNRIDIAKLLLTDERIAPLISLEIRSMMCLYAVLAGQLEMVNFLRNDPQVKVDGPLTLQTYKQYWREKRKNRPKRESSPSRSDSEASECDD